MKPFHNLAGWRARYPMSDDEAIESAQYCEAEAAKLYREATDLDERLSAEHGTLTFEQGLTLTIIFRMAEDEGALRARIFFGEDL